MGMVGAKIGTKTWSDAPQNDIQKTSGLKTLSATESQRFEGEDVGSVLNKIADPNYIDPSKKIRAVGNDKMDKDAFMRLMMAQMKNQDPTNPLKSHEMAAQLAQFSGLEQMQNMNTTLTEMKNAQKPTESFQALNFIGKAVSGDSAKVTRTKGDKTHDFNFILPDDAKELQIKIRNAEGDIVRKIELRDLKKGENKFTWNGQDERGTVTPAGDYQFFTEATNSSGKKLAIKTDFNGVITGINYSPEGPVLLVGTQSVKLRDVKKIVDPSLMQNGQNLKNAAGRDLKMPDQVENNEESQNDAGAPEKDLMKTNQGNLMDSVGMSRDMLTKLAKETKPDSGQTTQAPLTKAIPETKPEKVASAEARPPKNLKK
jgi:flagellar basal-body rod modification protein FlgD